MVRGPARTVESKGSGGSVSTIYMSVMVIRVVDTAVSDVGETPTNADAAVSVNPFRPRDTSSIIACSFD